MQTPSLSKIALLYMSYFLIGTYIILVGLAFPSIARSFGIQEIQEGYLFSVSALVMMATSFFATWWLSRIGYLSSYFVGSLLFSATMIGLGYAPNYFGLAMLFALTGLGQGMILVTLFSYFGSAKVRHRGTLYGFGEVGFYVAGALGGLLFSTLDSLGLKWSFDFATIGSINLVLTLANVASARKEFLGLRTSSLHLELPTLKAVISASLMFFANASWLLLAIWGPTYLLTSGYTNHGYVGEVMFAFGGISAGSSLLWGYVTDKTRSRWRILSVLLASAAIVSLLPFAIQASSSSLALFIGLIAVFLGPYYNLTLALSQESVPREMIPSTTALITVSLGASSATAPLLIGLVGQSSSLTLNFHVVLFALLALATLSVLLLRR
jgi:MFS family permease